jgi:hypothetical protein
MEIHRVRRRNIGKNLAFLLSHSANASGPSLILSHRMWLIYKFINIISMQKKNVNLKGYQYQQENEGSSFSSTR